MARGLAPKGSGPFVFLFTFKTMKLLASIQDSTSSRGLSKQLGPVRIAMLLAMMAAE